jgi:hypothetical protein
MAASPTFSPHDAHPYSGPEPTATLQSHVPHQWYITSEIPQTTISAGTCFGPDKTGLYLATRVNSFFSTGGDMNMQVTGVTNMDFIGDWLINVTGATCMTTPNTIDINAAQTITIVSGVGEPAALFPNFPGNESGDPSLGGADGVEGHTPKGRSGGNNTEKGKAENYGRAAEPLESPVSDHEFIEGLGGSLIEAGASCYDIYKSPLAGKFAAAGCLAAAAVGVAIGAVALAKASADMAAVAAAEQAASLLPPGAEHAGTRPEKGPPDIDMTAYGNIVGKAKTGIGWYTPMAIKSTADVAIVSSSPVIELNGDKIVHLSGGDFVWTQAGTEIKNEALTVVTKGTVIGSSALVANSIEGYVAASLTGLISAAVTGAIAASVTGLAFCELTSLGITNLEAGVLMTVEAPLYKSETAIKSEAGVSFSEEWASMNTMAASIKTEAMTYSLTSAMVTITAPMIALN